MAEEVALIQHAVLTSQARAEISVSPESRSPHPINPLLFGKFCEHLGSNIYNGMDAQILRNPTFGKWQFGGGEWEIDGGVKTSHDLATITQQIQNHAKRLRLLDSAPVVDAYTDGAAYHWFRLGEKDKVPLSPDVGPHGGRAQRVETSSTTGGIAQWIYLPLHRTRGYTFRVVARSSAPVDAELSIAAVDAAGNPSSALATQRIALKSEWSTTSGVFKIPADSPAAGLYRLALTLPARANVVFARTLLYPDDHINGADPDIIRLLKEAKLPLLRWPGGNFVSGYRWRDGVGPIDQRPTRPNPAWEGLEYNLMGTDEFIAYCRVVGCEPMICINAGDGTPEEAAAWVQYCNGSPETPMGALRAQNGHREPYRIKFWEVGNEISGRHQVSWTTPGGNVDRYLRFSAAMAAADPTIKMQGCGAPWGPQHDWNRRLIAETNATVRCVTDHILVGGRVNETADINDLYHAFLGNASALGRQYRAQRDVMLSAGTREPRLAITELQLFARAADQKIAPKLPTPASISEALYFATIVHECIRMGDFVEMITHSATVNHGGGLRKTFERAWANPVHYAHVMYAPFFNATPVALKISCGAYDTKTAYHGIPKQSNVSFIDGLAAIDSSGTTLNVMLVHRCATSGPITVSFDAGTFCGAPAEFLTLSGESMTDQNTSEAPDHIVPRRSTASLKNSVVEFLLAPYSMTRISLSKAK